MLNRRRLKDMVGVILMGDAITHFLGRRRHTRLWEARSAPESPYSRAVRYLADHPWASGLLSAGEFALGIKLTRQAETETASAG